MTSSGVFIVNFEHILSINPAFFKENHATLAPLLLTLVAFSALSVHLTLEHVINRLAWNCL